MEDITTRTKIGPNSQWKTRPVGNQFHNPNKQQDKDPLRCNKCGSTSRLANTYLKKTRINGIEIEKAEDTKEKNDVSLQKSDSEPSGKEELPDTFII
ncbi:hypothetical protein O181_023497 [Austropuccinia psidii MF-1]|uniref:Uncharacterized protein n=1 Tax=Austropuccinia psidii MF-1 TaxID=1389203 RepID=A0A9Q3CJM4_9BASI|nr:hypothetical protein [Austropuccinia psidii MF-1]